MVYDFENYDKKLKELYQKNPNKVTKELRNFVKRLESEDKSITTKGMLADLDKEKFLTVMICIAIALLGFINLFSNPESAVYFFGFVFFIAGYFVGATQKGAGLIFLFSHGGTGLGIMVGFTLSKLFENPVMKDGINNVHMYLGVVIAIFVIATIMTILRNLSDNFKAREYSLAFPLVLYFIGIFMVTLLPKIYNFILAL